MSTVRELTSYFNNKMLLGFSNAEVKLCRRGLDFKEEIELSVPTVGEQLSEDGQTVYLSGRVME